MNSKINSKNIAGVRMDYVLHALVFVPLAFLVTQYKSSKSGKQIDAFPYLLVIATGFELIHIFVPYRSFNVFDLLSNVVGVLFGFLIHCLLFIKRKAK